MSSSNDRKSISLVASTADGFAKLEAVRNLIPQAAVGFIEQIKFGFLDSVELVYKQQYGETDVLVPGPIISIAPVENDQILVVYGDGFMARIPTKKMIRMKVFEFPYRELANSWEKNNG